MSHQCRSSPSGLPISIRVNRARNIEMLLQRAGRPVGKGQLVERLCEWGEEVSHNGIDVYIHRLRKRIEKGCARP